MYNPTDPTIMFDKYQRASNALGIGDYSNQIIHYTSESVLQRILATKTLWFGALPQMNDRAECDHFLEEILRNSSQLLGEFDAHALEDVIQQIRPAIREETFVSSWCEYFDAEPNGKLSMWRAYADQGAGVGLVVDSSQMQPSQITPQKANFHLYSTKVEYIRANRAVTHANDVIRRLSSLPELSGTLVEKLQLAILLLSKAPCVKHDGFAEEEEVRFLYMKGLLKLFGQSDLNETIQTIQTPTGVKRFYAFELRAYPQSGFDFRIETVLKKVVIGPSPDQAQRAERSDQLLKAHGLGHIPIELCRIPLR